MWVEKKLLLGVNYTWRDTPKACRNKSKTFSLENFQPVTWYGFYITGTLRKVMVQHVALLSWFRFPNRAWRCALEKRRFFHVTGLHSAGDSHASRSWGVLWSWPFIRHENQLTDPRNPRSQHRNVSCWWRIIRSDFNRDFTIHSWKA